LKKKGKRDATIKNVGKALNRLVKEVNLQDSEEVKGFIATLECSDGYKRNLVYAYDQFCKYYNIKWEKPKYNGNSRYQKIPLEKTIDMIIANSPLKMALALSISKDTGLRPIEVMSLRVRDIDLESGKVYPSTAKRGCARVLRLKDSTRNILVKYLAKKDLSINDRLFEKWNSDTYGKWFRYHRNKLAKKLNDPSIKTVRLYDIRHFFATMFYHKTRDLLMLKNLMGHKKIETTLIYTQLVHFNNDNEYYSATAKTVKEARKLIESGFEYICEIQGIKLFRKRK